MSKKTKYDPELLGLCRARESLNYLQCTILEIIMPLGFKRMLAYDPITNSSNSFLFNEFAKCLADKHWFNNLEICKINALLPDNPQGNLSNLRTALEWFLVYYEQMGTLLTQLEMKAIGDNDTTMEYGDVMLIYDCSLKFKSSQRNLIDYQGEEQDNEPPMILNHYG